MVEVDCNVGMDEREEATVWDVPARFLTQCKDAWILGVSRLRVRAHAEAGRRLASLRRVACDEEGQGTTEYAILVGVLVVIAIVAIIAFRGKVQELWDAISNSINGL
ncbi:MAG: hypothetical protein KHY83_05160 [Coriobacteriia bacterium]|nr:hypothetical protein [Coriobacteriia bacterium]MBS5478035.1 hypothetical protein [Coriobacteriia bacterium]